MVDVIAIKRYIKTAVLLIQCKTGKGLMTKKEREEFVKYGEALGCTSLLAYRIGRKLIIE